MILIDIAEFLFSFFCHQRAESLFTVLGQSLPICTRCAGIYLGALLTFTTLSSTGFFRVRWSAGMALLTVMFLEWITGNLGLTTSTVASRLLTGTLGGAGAAIILMHYGRRLSWSGTFILSVLVLGIMATTSLPTTILFLIICSFGLFWFNAAITVKSFILQNQSRE